MSICKECFDQYTDQGDFLLRVVNSAAEQDTRRLASDILYGLLSTMYEMDEEECREEDEEQSQVYEGDGYTITTSPDGDAVSFTITNLGDLFTQTTSHISE